MLDGIGAPALDVSAPIDSSIDTSPDTDSLDTPPEPIDPFKGTKHKIKAKGKEIELDYEDLLKKAEKAEGADQIFKDNAMTRKEKAALEAKLAKISSADVDPLELVEMMGFENAKKFTDTFMRKLIEWEEYTDQEREQILRDHEAEQDRAELRSYKERESSEKAKLAQEQAISVVDKEIGEAIAYAKEQGLSVADGPHFVEQLVDEMVAYLEYCDDCDKAGKPITKSPPSAKDVAKRLQQRQDEATKAFLKKHKASSLRSMLDSEQLDELRQAQIDELYAPTSRLTASKRAAEQDVIDPFANKKSGPKSTKDWFSAMEETFKDKK